MHSGNTGDHKHVLLLQLSHALLLCFAQLLYTGFIPVAPPVLGILFHLFEADPLTTKDTLSLSAAAGNPLTCSFHSPCLRFPSDARPVIKIFVRAHFLQTHAGFSPKDRLVGDKSSGVGYCDEMANYFFWGVSAGSTHRPPGALRRHVGIHVK